MFRIGLSSSAFLASTPEEVVASAKSLGFEGVEWAGTPHMGPGDPASASRIMLTTLRAGLTIVSYAPMYRVVPGGGRGISFDTLLDLARDIYAPVIRVYAGEASRSDPPNRPAFVDELKRLGDKVGRNGITLAISPSARSLLPGLGEAVSVVGEADSPYVKIAWEPVQGDAADFGVSILEEYPGLFAVIRPRAVDPEGHTVPLESEAARWKRLIAAFSSKPGPTDVGRFMLLGGIGDCPDETFSKDLAFARGAASISKS